MAIETKYLLSTGANDGDEIEDSDDTENSGAGMSDEEEDCERAEGEPLISDTNRFNQLSTCCSLLSVTR